MIRQALADRGQCGTATRNWRRRCCQAIGIVVVAREAGVSDRWIPTSETPKFSGKQGVAGLCEHLAAGFRLEFAPMSIPVAG